MRFYGLSKFDIDRLTIKQVFIFLSRMSKVAKTVDGDPGSTSLPSPRTFR